ncbi:phosphatase PAP2 family protein [Eubacterium ruminantium]|uniref:phosphatase PAP2 family protein n=1 Tax=Eubacterium ruminantium TaxID=42322 RepID=UPI0024788E25|nr:phosphatase PAP2 family protein [Eubacterium ruminantium]
MKKYFVAAGICGLLFIALIIIVKNVDVSAIGPEGTSIGLSGINKDVHEATGLSLKWDDATDKLSYLAFMIGGVFALMGLLQLIARKSIAKVDKEILSLGVIYAIMGGLYVIFDKIVINYRPEILPDEKELESSFPSSHTMLACVILGTAIVLIGKYINNRNITIIVKAIFAVVLVLSVAGRLLSGVHWLTDIIGGVLISFVLIFIYAGLVKAFAESKSKRVKE